MKVKLTLALLALASLLPLQAGTPAPAPAPVQPTVSAEEISYNNASLGYLFRQLNGPDVLEASAHGVGLGLEFSPAESIYLAAGGSWVNGQATLPVIVDGSPVLADLDIDYYTANVGAGYYIPLADSLHFVTEVGVNYANLDVAGTSDGTWGVYATPHLRYKAGPFEVHAGISYSSNENSLVTWDSFARLVYEVSEGLDFVINASTSINDSEGLSNRNFGNWSTQSLGAGLRLKF